MLEGHALVKRRHLPLPDADWPPPLSSDEPEVTLFNLPGSQGADARFVDVNSAARLNIGGRIIAPPMSPANVPPQDEVVGLEEFRFEQLNDFPL